MNILCMGLITQYMPLVSNRAITDPVKLKCGIFSTDFLAVSPRSLYLKYLLRGSEDLLYTLLLPKMAHYAKNTQLAIAGECC